MDYSVIKGQLLKRSFTGRLWDEGSISPYFSYKVTIFETKCFYSTSRVY